MPGRALAWMALAAAVAAFAVPFLPNQWQEWIGSGQQKVVLVRDVVVGESAAATPTGDGTTPADSATSSSSLHSWHPGVAPAVTPEQTTPPSPADPRRGGPAAPTPTPKSAAQPASDFPLEELRRYMVDLINQDREAHSLAPVFLGSNPAAQEHAQEMLEYSYLSHWDLGGLKPYMRYTLAGGVNYEAENVSGIAAPLEDGLLYQEQSPLESVREAQVGFMNSPGHRANILNRWHKQVNVGIACNLYTCAVVQQFQGDYVEFTWTPTLDFGRLALEGFLAEPFTVSSVQVWYDEPPHPLTLGQLDATYAYRLGQTPAVFLRKPAPAGSFYPRDSTDFSWKSGVDPYQVSPDAPRRKAVCVNNVCSAALPREQVVTNTDTVPLVTADVWETSGGFFRIEADIGPVIGGPDSVPGVYTVVVWGEAGGASAPLTNYSIMVGGTDRGTGPGG